MYQPRGKITNGTVSLKRDANNKIIGKIDIVAHSMGYAYAQGMIDFLKNHLPQDANKKYLNTFGKFYILMPENPCSATTFDKDIFEEVWQYGSDEINDPLWEQDGVAPQCPVGVGAKALSWTIVDSKYGRVPNTTAPASKKNFLDAHSYFDWIFDLVSGRPGYVNKR